MRPLTVLSVGYPLAAVSPDAAGGAEQILSTLDRTLVAAGHRSVIVAPAGSSVAGTLQPIEPQPAPLDDRAKAAAQADTAAAIAAVRAREPVDLIHLHGIDFPAYLPPPGGPVLATLHLPVAWYPPDALRPSRPATFIHAVSEAQHRDCPPSPALLRPIENGVPIEALAAAHAKRGFALFLGRICPEKGVHLAIAAARLAEVPLLIAGQVYPYAEHQLYFATEVAPHLGPRCRFLGPIGFARKRRLLSAARCLLLPALAPETSSLVAREAAACGTPAIAFPQGALGDTIRHGQTGFLAADVAAMAEAIGRSGAIRPELCREHARTHFSERVMTDRYLALYERLAEGGVS